MMIYTGLNDYLKLFDIYADSLIISPREPAGGTLALLFEQTIRLLGQDSEFNSRLPAPFREVAFRYLKREPAIHDHFSYDENRHFFLSDFNDYIQLEKIKDRKIER